MAGKLTIDRPNLAELMCASNVLAALRIHDDQAHKIIADAIVERLQHQRNGIANALVGFTEGMKVPEPHRSQLLRQADLIRRGLELHWKEDADDDIRPMMGISASEGKESTEPTP